ncbi:DUF885 domain-containing protein [Luteimonas suaedae]|uniref:DUF885 domain-containing protein n=1 Tax=Luteimonas suaedae TaxID=2605430 RepID=UPI001CA7FA9B|nr:DUF885 domain-containing protein [Luteimonas suaedae]
MRKAIVAGLALVWLGAMPVMASDAQMTALADRAVALALEQNPASAYLWGLPAPDHRRWPDRSPEAIARHEAIEDALLTELRALDPAALERSTARLDHALLTERLEAGIQHRVCRSELWDVNHMSGWHLMLPHVAREQPVGSAEERAQALQRWSAVPDLVDREIANLRRGLEGGWSAPRSVVRRVIGQVTGLASATPEDSPLSEPAKRSDDAAFAQAFRTVIADEVNPALARFGAFLEADYLPHAREALAVSANPDGEACYQASLRLYTTLDRGAQEVHDIGAAAVARNIADIETMGERAFGTRDLAQILRRVREAPDNRFESEQALIDYSREVVARARQASARLFLSMPEQEMLSEPFMDFMRGSGTSAHYEPSADVDRPAYYRIDSEGWADETRGSAEITAVHEGYPGHHMQFASALALEKTPLAKMSFNSAYAEGWGRYSERLAEEAGIYSNDYAKIQRRAWPARGMVADPGLHVLGWSRQQTIDYLMETGRFGADETEALVDRMAMLPGQLTAYDSGGLEIVALRQQAEEALGDDFDIRRFHDVVLGQGTIPLQTLRRSVEAWIAMERTSDAP